MVLSSSFGDIILAVGTGFIKAMLAMLLGSGGPNFVLRGPALCSPRTNP